MNGQVAFELGRLALVVALVAGAAALTVPRGRLPLAMRGLAKLFRVQAQEQSVPVWKKLLAFAFVLLALILALGVL